MSEGAFAVSLEWLDVSPKESLIRESIGDDT